MVSRVLVGLAHVQLSGNNLALEYPLFQIPVFQSLLNFLEIESPGDKGDSSRFNFAIGTRGNNKFKPCLMISSDCKVFIDGSLTVEGQLIQGPVQPDLDDPDFVEEMGNRWLQGMLTGLMATLGLDLKGSE